MGGELLRAGGDNLILAAVAFTQPSLVTSHPSSWLMSSPARSVKLTERVSESRATDQLGSGPLT